MVIEQECPQCGASIKLSETDHIFTCPYCDVMSYLHTPSYFRYLLPHKALDKDIIYVPYLRFKGIVFFCDGIKIKHRIIDITQTGVRFKGIPISLGLRPQAMTARFATDETHGSFMRFSLRATDILARASKLTQESAGNKLLHRAFIGETMSIIYLPVYVERDRIFDAILKRPITGIKGGRDTIEPVLIKRFPETVTFIPTICPRCGWTMSGEKDSVVLLCDNCGNAWEPQGTRFVQLERVIASNKNNNSVYLPFWKITAKTKGVNIKSFADFVRITNQPIILNEEHETIDMSYWCPAFKIRPKMFLNLSKQLTVMQNFFENTDSIPEKGLYPVTLPSSEAVQSLKIILAASAITKRNVYPYLPKINLNIKKKKLVFLPFRETRNDMIQDDLGLSVNRQSLELGRGL